MGWLQWVLLLGGGGLQVGGVVLAAWDLVDAYRRWRVYQHRLRPGEAEFTADAVIVGATPDVWVSGPPPPLEDRMASLERAVRSLQRGQADARVEDAEATRTRVDRTRATVLRRLTSEDEALAGLFRGVVIGGRRRWVGLACFLTGIVAATVGSLPVWGR